MIDAAAELVALIDAAGDLVSSEPARATLRSAALVFGDVHEPTRTAAKRRAMGVSLECEPAPAERSRYVDALRATCGELAASERLGAAVALLAPAYAQRSDDVLESVFLDVVDVLCDEIESAYDRATLIYAHALLLERDVLLPPA